LRLFVGYAPGGGQDQVARLLGQGLAERIGQQVMFSSLAGAVPYIRQAKLRALGVTTARRSPTLPDVPAIGEQVEGYDASGLIGVGAPRGVPSDIAELLNRHLSAVAAQPNAQARFTDLGSAVADLSPAAFGQYMGREIERWRGVIVAAGIKPE
jgi:tripartite-type tricarboxylate transporter receptor subunit TctC